MALAYFGILTGVVWRAVKQWVCFIPAGTTSVWELFVCAHHLQCGGLLPFMVVSRASLCSSFSKRKVLHISVSSNLCSQTVVGTSRLPVTSFAFIINAGSFIFKRAGASMSRGDHLLFWLSSMKQGVSSDLSVHGGEDLIPDWVLRKDNKIQICLSAYSLSGCW